MDLTEEEKSYLFDAMQYATILKNNQRIEMNQELLNGLINKLGSTEDFVNGIKIKLLPCVTVLPKIYNPIIQRKS